MPRKLTVFGGSFDGRRRVVMATTSKTAFCKLHRHLRRDYVCETHNETEIALCMEKPGTAFIRNETDWNGPYIEWKED